MLPEALPQWGAHGGSRVWQLVICFPTWLMELGTSRSSDPSSSAISCYHMTPSSLPDHSCLAKQPFPKLGPSWPKGHRVQKSLAGPCRPPRVFWEDGGARAASHEHVSPQRLACSCVPNEAFEHGGRSRGQCPRPRPAQAQDRAEAWPSHPETP